MRRPLVPLVALTALAAVLRFATLDVQSFWLDEAVTAHLVRLPLGDMLDRLPDSESTPPLYYLLAWVWERLFGHGEVGLRSLSALLGTATVPVVFAAARELLWERAALAAAALAATSPLLVWYSQEARAYALLVLLGALSFLFFARVLRRGEGLLWWAVASALALATHYFAAFPLAAEAVWLLAACGRRALPAVLAVGASGAALVPLAVAQSDNPKFIEESGLGTRALQLPKQFLVGFDAPLEIALGVLGAVAAAGALALLWRSGDRRRALPAAAVALAAAGLPLLLAVAGEDYFVTRNALPALVPALILLGAGAERSRALLGVLLALGLFCVVAVAVEPSYQREDWRGAAEALGPVPPGGRAIVLSPASGGTAFELYRPDAVLMPGPGAAVSEVVLVGLAPRVAGESRTPPRTAPAPVGFRLVQRENADTFTLLRFRAPRPLGETPPGLNGVRLGIPSAVVLLER